MTRISTALATASLAGALLTFFASGAGAASRSFYCGEASTLKVTVLNGGTAIQAGPIDGQTLTMQVVDGKPYSFFYGDYAIIIADDQKSLKLEVPDFGTIDCAYQAAGSLPAGDTPASEQTDNGQETEGFPIAAQSLGGTLRAGPGTGFKVTASLSNGQPITILEQADAPFYQDRPWFKIKYGKKTGYTWAGIVCSLSGPIAGTPGACG